MASTTAEALTGGSVNSAERRRLSWAVLDGDAVVFDRHTLLTHRLTGLLADRWIDLFGIGYQQQLESDAVGALDDLGLAALRHAPPPSGESWRNLCRAGSPPSVELRGDGVAVAVSIAGRQLTVRCAVDQITALIGERFAGDPQRDNEAPATTVGDIIDVAWDGTSIVLAVDGAVIQVLPDEEEAAGFLWWAMNLCAASHQADDTLVHAAAASQSGRAVVLTGLSGAGKSTLLAALIARGMLPVSDEITRIAGGYLWPWPSPIDVDERSLVLLDRADVAKVSGPVDPVVGSVLAVVSHAADEPPSELIPLDRFSALEHLLAGGFHPDGRTCDDFDRLVALAQSAICVECRGSDPIAKAQALGQLLDD